MMTLTEEQAKQFYRLWVPLMDYVNRRYRIDKAFYGMTTQRGLPLDVVVKITTKLWENISIIDEYLEIEAKGMAEDDKIIVRSWKRARQGKYIVDRILSRGAALISIEDGKVYIVKGIYSDWRELLENGPVPQIIQATLIPFEECIIYDGVIMPYNMMLGRNMAEQSAQLYKNAKTENKLIQSF